MRVKQKIQNRPSFCLQVQPVKYEPFTARWPAVMSDIKKRNGKARKRWGRGIEACSLLCHLKRRNHLILRQWEHNLAAVAGATTTLVLRSHLIIFALGLRRHSKVVGIFCESSRESNPNLFVNLCCDSRKILSIYLFVWMKRNQRSTHHLSECPFVQKGQGVASSDPDNWPKRRKLRGSGHTK